MAQEHEAIKKPRVTVVVAAYNLERCIRDSVRSLQEQDYDDFEILVCEDCSTDGTYSILKEMEREDSRIRLIRNDTNSGQAFGRNRCIELARGEYIAIHDGDDYSKPARLKKQAEFLDENKEYAFAASIVETIDDDKNVTDRPYTVSEKFCQRLSFGGCPLFIPQRCSAHRHCTKSADTA